MKPIVKVLIAGVAVFAAYEVMKPGTAAASQKTTPQSSPSLPLPLPAPSPSPLPPASTVGNPFLVGPDGQVIFQNDPNVGNPNLPPTGAEAAVPGNPGAFTPDDFANMAAAGGDGSNFGEQGPMGDPNQITGTQGFRRRAYGFNPFSYR